MKIERKKKCFNAGKAQSTSEVLKGKGINSRGSCWQMTIPSATGILFGNEVLCLLLWPSRKWGEGPWGTTVFCGLFWALAWAFFLVSLRFFMGFFFQRKLNIKNTQTFKPQRGLVPQNTQVSPWGAVPVPAQAEVKLSLPQAGPGDQEVLLPCWEGAGLCARAQNAAQRQERKPPAHQMTGEYHQCSCDREMWHFRQLLLKSVPLMHYQALQFAQVL